MVSKLSSLHGISCSTTWLAMYITLEVVTMSVATFSHLYTLSELILLLILISQSLNTSLF